MGAELVLYCIIASLNVCSMFVQAISSFGYGLLYQLGWQILSQVSGTIDGEISSATLHITLTTIISYPLQFSVLYKHTDWKLGLNISVAQQIGNCVGIYLVTTYDSDWLPRALGLLMSVVVVQRAVIEAKANSLFADVAAAIDSQNAITEYTFNSWESYAIVYATGLVSGVFGGMFGAGGPPLVYFTSAINLDKDVSRATLMLIFVLQNFGRVAFMYIVTPSDAEKEFAFHTENFWILFAVLNGAAWIALVLGNIAVKHINQKCFRYLNLSVLTLGSVLFLTEGLQAMDRVLAAMGALLCYIVAGLIILAPDIWRTFWAPKQATNPRQHDIEMTADFCMVSDDSTEIHLDSMSKTGDLQEGSGSNAQHAFSTDGNTDNAVLSSLHSGAEGEYDTENNNNNAIFSGPRKRSISGASVPIDLNVFSETIRSNQAYSLVADTDEVGDKGNEDMSRNR